MAIFDRSFRQAEMKMEILIKEYFFVSKILYFGFNWIALSIMGVHDKSSEYATSIDDNPANRHPYSTPKKIISFNIRGYSKYIWLKNFNFFTFQKNVYIKSNCLLLIVVSIKYN